MLFKVRKKYASRAFVNGKIARESKPRFFHVLIDLGFTERRLTVKYEVILKGGTVNFVSADILVFSHLYSVFRISTDKIWWFKIYGFKNVISIKKTKYLRKHLTYVDRGPQHPKTLKKTKQFSKIIEQNYNQSDSLYKTYDN